MLSDDQKVVLIPSFVVSPSTRRRSIRDKAVSRSTVTRSDRWCHDAGEHDAFEVSGGGSWPSP